MQLASIAAIVAASASSLQAARPRTIPKKPWIAHDRNCEQFGFKRGTPEPINCRFEQARQATPRAGAPGTDEPSPGSPLSTGQAGKAQALFCAAVPRQGRRRVRRAAMTSRAGY
jgi:hypothetical protein